MTQQNTAAMQAAFDTVLTKLRAQGVASVATDGGTCQYRSAYGCCAVGHLLPEDLAITNVDNGLVVSELIGEYHLPELAELGVTFLDDLQQAHDCLMPLAPDVEEASRLRFFREGRFGVDRSLEAWEQHMQFLASYHELSYTPPTP